MSRSEIACVISEDLPGLAAFLAAFPGLGGSADWWRDRFRLWWDENPAFRPELPRGWQLRVDGRLAGFLAHVPGLMTRAGHTLTVFSVSTWMVLPEHRGLGLGLLLRQLEASKDTLLFDATPTAEVAAILENLGFERLRPEFAPESFLPLRHERCLKAGLPFLEFLPDALWSAAGSIMRAMERSRLRALRPDPALGAAEVEDPGPEFDRFWRRTSVLAGLTNVRTAAVLRWHCRADTAVRKRLFACLSAGDVAGYVILKERRRRGLRVLECVDWWFDPAVPSGPASLLSFVRARAVSEGFDLLTVAHWSAEVRAALRSMGLWEARLGPRRTLCLAGPGAPVRPSEGPSYFVGLQGDYGTSP